jgi:glycosyltransferase involved in cell wall biosynthesis
VPALSIAIATFEFEGITKNGGVGTAYRRLAELLIDQGHQVTVALLPYTNNLNLKTFLDKPNKELSAIRSRGIEVVFPERKTLKSRGKFQESDLKRSLLVYDFLRSRKFDVVHAPDTGGLVFCSLVAKALRSDFCDCRFIIGAHGSALWVAESNGYRVANEKFLSIFDQMSIEVADYLVSPSSYMLMYLKQKNWKLPKTTLKIPNVNSLHKRSRISKPLSRQFKGQKKLVFFGRLEPRKGFYLFTHAVERLLLTDPQLGIEEPLSVIFLGSQHTSLWKTSDSIRFRLGKFANRVQLKFIENYSSAQSLKYLTKNPGHLVCIPSLKDNSPYVIVEAIEQGLDFIASQSGGQAELIHVTDQKSVLCKPEVEAWATAIRKRMQMDPIRVRPSQTTVDANLTWLRLHDEIASGKRQRAVKD